MIVHATFTLGTPNHKSFFTEDKEIEICDLTKIDEEIKTEYDAWVLENNTGDFVKNAIYPSDDLLELE